MTEAMEGDALSNVTRPASRSSLSILRSVWIRSASSPETTIGEGSARKVLGGGVGGVTRESSDADAAMAVGRDGVTGVASTDNVPLGDCFRGASEPDRPSGEAVLDRGSRS